MVATGDANEDRPRSAIDKKPLAHQVHEAWEKKAAFWDEKMMGDATDPTQRFRKEQRFNSRWRPA